MSSAGVTRASALTSLAALAVTPRIASAQAALLPVKVGSGNVEPNAQVFYAIEAGIFKKNGLSADLTILRSGGVTMEAIVTGTLNCGVSNVVSLGSALLRGLPFKIIAPGILERSDLPTNGIVVAANSPIKSAKDLNGATLGVTSLGSTDGLGFQTYMDKNGGDSSTVKFIEIVPAAMAEAIATGRVAAGVINDPELRNAISGGKVKKLVNAYDWISPMWYGTVWLCTQDWLAANKETAKRFAASIIEAGAWAEANREQSLTILEKYTKFHEDKSIATYGRTLDRKLLQPVWDAAYKYKTYPAQLNASDYFWDGK
jgi:NitT/TauT family transport system substrate-binding protein